VDDAVKANTALFTLKDTQNRVSYDTLLRQRTELEEDFLGLLRIQHFGALVSPVSGRIHSTEDSGKKAEIAVISPDQQMSVTIDVDEADILRWSAYNDLHFIRCACRFTEEAEAAGEDSGFSKRQEMKELLQTLKKTNPNIENSMFNSIHNVHLDTFVGYRTLGKDHFILERFDSKTPDALPEEE
jgi:hypothetical protein